MTTEKEFEIEGVITLKVTTKVFAESKEEAEIKAADESRVVLMPKAHTTYVDTFNKWIIVHSQYPEVEI